MTLSEIVNIVEIVGMLAILSGIWIGIKQLKILRNQRRDLSIMECARSFEDKEFTESYSILNELKPGISLAEMRLCDKKYELAALRAGMKFETIGLLVFKGVVPIDAMEDLVGGAAIHIWKILEVWVRDNRIESNHQLFLEWYEWLVDRLRDRGDHMREPAYSKYKNWQGLK